MNSLFQNPMRLLFGVVVLLVILSQSLAIVPEDKQALIVNLPNSALWEAHGLGWLTSCPQCCGQNIHNLALWRGPFCECTQAS